MWGSGVSPEIGTTQLRAVKMILVLVRQTSARGDTIEMAVCRVQYVNVPPSYAEKVES